MTKGKTKGWIGVYGALAVLLFTVGLFDPSISQAIYKEGSSSGGFFEITGEPPAIILFCFSVNVLFVCHTHKRERISDFVWGIIGLTYLADKLATDLIPSGAPALWQCLLLATLTQILCALVFSRVLRRRHRGYFLHREADPALERLCENCRLAATACLITLFCAFFLKALWGRVRYRDVLAGKGAFSFFALPQFFTGHFSFPSGHTANAACFMAVSYFVKDKTKKRVLQLLLTVWLVLVGLSRVRLGAHFLTDVIAGAAVGLSAFGFAPRVVAGLRKSLGTSPEETC